MRLDGQVREVTSLFRSEKERMFELMDFHFVGMVFDRFVEDLAEKEWVLLLRDVEEGTIQGFTTAMFIDREVQGVPIRAVYSGDTIINKEYWGEKTMGVLWLKFVLDAHRRCPDRRLF